MEPKKLLRGLSLVWLAFMVTAYTNDTMTGPYLKLVNNDPFHAIFESYTAVWGQWFYLLLAVGPYLAMWLYQRDFTIPTIWLTFWLASYSYLVREINTPVFYLVVVLWFASAMVRALSPVYKQ